MSHSSFMPEEEVREQLLQLADFNLDVYRDIFSSEYVYDVIYNHPERLQKLRPILEKLKFIQHTHFIFTIIFDNFWAICENKTNAHRYQLKRALLNQTRSALAEIHPASVAATLIGTDKVVVLMECTGMPEQEAEQYSYHCAELLRDHIMQKTTFSVSIGVSNYCRTPSAAWQAYEQSFRALSGSFVLGYANILKYQQKEPSSGGFRENEVSAIAKRFASAVCSHDAELCRQHVEHLFRRLTIITTDENYIKSYVVLVLSEVVQYSIRLGMDANTLSHQLVVMIQTIFRSGTIAKLQEGTISFLAELIRANERYTRALADRMSVTRAYMEQFHAENISLSDLAQLCGYSEAYFCRLFKKTFGQTYSDFLMECRIAHAKQLLQETGNNISDIAEETGFHSFSHFCVCFRKRTGKTPSEYRRTCLADSM